MNRVRYWTSAVVTMALGALTAEALLQGPTPGGLLLFAFGLVVLFAL